jgi:PAS domain S-box-containing protein
MSSALFKNSPIQLLRALAESSKLMLSNGSQKHVINKVLSILGETALVDRVYVFKNTYIDGALTNMNHEFEWCGEGVDRYIENPELQNVPWENYEDLKPILAGGNQFKANTKELTNDVFREALEMQSIKSVLFMPIFTDQIFWGWVGFDDCKNERNWDEVDLMTLSSIASNMGAFIQRKMLRKQLDEQHTQLQQQKTLYEGIINNVPADIVVIDNDGRYRFVSKTAITNDEIRNWIIGKTDVEYCEYRNKSKDIADKRGSQINYVINNLQTVTHEEKFGSGIDEKYYLRILHPVLNEDKKLDYLLGYGMDITDIKQRDELILKQHRAIDDSPAGIALLDAEGKFYYMNKSHAEIFEYEVDELIGKQWQVLYEQDEIDKISNVYFPILAEKKTWSGEALGITKFGKPRLQNITLSMFDDGSLVCITRDITETKNELNKLQSATQQLDLAMKASNLGMWTWNIPAKEVVFTEVALNMIQYTVADYPVMSKEDWLVLAHPEDRSLVEKAVELHFNSIQPNEEKLYNAEYRIRRKDGKYIWVLSVGKVTKFDDNGIPTEMIGFILDVNKQKELDEKIKENEKRYRDLVESLKEVIFQADNEGNWTFLNQSWEEITGFGIDDSIGQRASKFMHNDDITKFLNISKRLYDDGAESVNDEIRFIDKNGHVLWFDFHVSLHKDLAGNPIGVVGSAENITFRKEVEAELELNRELLQKVISSIDDVIWSYDIANGNLSYISPSCQNMTGFHDDDFYKNVIDWYDLLDDDSVSKLRKSDNDLHIGRIQARDMVYQLSFGNPVKHKWVRDQAKLICDEQGKPARVDGVTIDITDLIHAEQQLKISEEKYRLISENIQDVVSILDVEGKVRYISPSAERVTGYPQESLLENNIFEAIHPEDQIMVRSFLQNVAKSKGDDKISFRFLKANGEQMWLETLVTVLSSSLNKKNILLQASSRDITLRIKAEIELTKALQKEKELGELKSRFVSMASHEFRTPLSTIRVGAELIKAYIEKDEIGLTPRMNAKVNDKLEEIMIDVDRISELMADILTMGKIEASKVPFNPSFFSVNNFITDYIAQEAPKQLLDKKFVCNIAEIEGIVAIDIKLMKQVLQNTISNAIKYSSADTAIEFNLYKLQLNKVVFEVKDNGIGIPEKDLNFLFESFYRATNVENIPGTGLGLSIMKLFMEMHGGEIKIDSVVNVGTTVRLILPLQYD